MTIHHVIIKQAANHGVIMTEVEGDEGRILVKAHWAEYNKVFVHPNAKVARDAALACITLHNEWPAVTIEQADDMAFNLVYNGEVILEDVDVSNKTEMLADLIDRCHELEIDPAEETDEEDETPSGCVVKAKYKEIYAERGHPDDCGDNLAEYCRGLDLDEFITMCSENGVMPSVKVAGVMETKARGWQGRVRMSMGNSLRRVIREQGFLIHIGAELKIKL